MAIIAPMPAGFLETTGDNEVNIRSDIRDPGKYRTSVDEDQVESNLGSISHNTRRVDGSNVPDERVQYGGRLLDDGTPAFFVSLAMQKGDPVSEHLVVSRHGLSGPAAPSVNPGRVYSPSRRYFLNVQDDENLVIVEVMPDGSEVPRRVLTWSEP